MVSENVKSELKYTDNPYRDWKRSSWKVHSFQLEITKKNSTKSASSKMKSVQSVTNPKAVTNPRTEFHQPQDGLSPTPR